MFRKFVTLLCAATLAAFGLSLGLVATSSTAAAESHPFNKTAITYRFANGTNDIAGTREFQAVRDALQLWSSVTDFRFTEKTGVADIEFKWATGFHGDVAPLGWFDGRGGVAAHALAGNYVHFDDDEDWTLSVRSSIDQPLDLVTSAAHEIGHMLGLGESSDPQALMYRQYQGSHRWLASSDIAQIQKLYPRARKSRIATHDPNAGCYVREGAVTAPPVLVYGRECLQIEVSGDRIFVRNSSNVCLLKEGALNASWSTQATDCAWVAVDGTRLGYVKNSDDSCYVKEGPSNARWVQMRGNCWHIILDQLRIGVADYHGGWCHVKEGNLNAYWSDVRGPNCDDIALSGNRIGTRDADGYCYAKEGQLNAAWTAVPLFGPGCLSIDLAAQRAGTVSTDGYCYLKEGSLNAAWLRMKGPGCGQIELSGQRIGTQNSGSTCEVREGPVYAPWTRVAANCHRILLSLAN